MLPDGIHTCTVDEIEATFSIVTTSTRRLRLFDDLRRYIDEVRLAGIGKFLIVDGSYVTGKEEPNDIDVMLVLRDDVDLNAPVPPFEYNSRSRRYVKKEFGLDFYHAFEGDASYEKMLGVFREVRNAPEQVKGVLKVVL